MAIQSVLIISFTPIASEPRVLRQIFSFHNAGLRVAVAGRTPAPENGVAFINIDFPPRGKTSRALLARIYRRLKHILSRLYALFLACLVMTGLSPKFALRVYWQNAYYGFVHDKLASSSRPDLIVAHDWFTTPIAARLAETWNIPFVVDIHEYARMQNPVVGGLLARLRHYVTWGAPLKAVHRQLYPRAYALSCVCDGIADLVRKEEHLPHRPITVRSTPFYEEQPFRPCGETITVLYHGIFSAKRKLDMLLRAAPLCDARFRFVLRGHGEELATLAALSKSLGIEDRVRFEAAVPFAEIVPAANTADIGYIVLDDFSPQHRFVLPNKFFEYIMAGLGLVVSDFPEMSKLVRQYENGALVSGCTPQAVAAALNSLTDEGINAMKRRSLAAAQELCWEREQHSMLAAYGLEHNKPEARHD